MLVEGDDILGDGVNIAARLEALCEPGGVLISGTAMNMPDYGRNIIYGIVILVLLLLYGREEKEE